MVEDSVNGVLAAKAAGMTAWGFIGGGHCLEGFDARLRAAGAELVIDAWPAFTRTFSGGLDA